MTDRRRPRLDSHDRSTGASAVEYALIVAALAAAMLLVLGGLQRGMTAAYQATSADISAPQSVQTPSASSSSSSGGSGSSSSSSSSSSPASGSSSSSSSSPASGGSSSTPVSGGSSSSSSSSSSTPDDEATPPAGAVTVKAGKSVTVLSLSNGAKSDSPGPSVTPARGTPAWSGGDLQFTASAGAPTGPVTVTYTVKANGKTTTTTVTVWIV
jgi:Flp pilus assembly pilin Flp